jgi:predicted DNA-binding protein (UPF0251 family)
MSTKSLEALLRAQKQQLMEVEETLRVGRGREHWELLRFKEVQHLLRVSRTTLWRMVRRGLLRVVEPVPGLRRIPLEEVIRLVGGREVPNG